MMMLLLGSLTGRESVGAAEQPAARGRPGWLPGLAAAQKKQRAHHDGTQASGKTRRARRSAGRNARGGPWRCPSRYAARRSQLGGDGLYLGVVVEHLVAHFTSPAGLLVPAEGQRGVEHVVAVDPDGAGPELLRQGMRLGDVLGPDARAEAVLRVVGDGGDLVQVAERGGDQDRAEDLLADDLHVRAGVGEHGRLDE